MRPTILIVEDSELVGFSLCESFLADGFDVRFVSDPDIAREPDGDESAVVMSDLRVGMDGPLDGAEIVRIVRALHPAAVIVLLSSFTTSDAEANARAAGADAVLPKSASFPAIVRNVRELIQQRQANPTRPTT